MSGSLDTNVLVRLLVKDDVAQNDAASRLLLQHSGQGQVLFVPITVMLELEWVLRSRYRFGKPDVLQAVSALLAAAELEFESEDALEQALLMFEESPADLADCLHLALARKSNALPFWTFDAAAAKAPGAQRIA